MSESFLKNSQRMPSIRERQKLLRDDLLRDLDVFENWDKQSSEAFTENFLRRVFVARFDPRVAESCVERLVLMAHKIDAVKLREGLKSTSVAQSCAVLYCFAMKFLKGQRKILSKKSKDNLDVISFFYPALQKLLSPMERQNAFQSFYIDLYNPGSKLTSEIIKNNLKIWEIHGFWAASAPYSKELLARFKAPLVFHSPLNRRSIDLLIIEAFQSDPRWLSMDDIFKISQVGISKRQLLRRLKKIPQIQKSGQLKGMRYRLQKTNF